MAFIEDESKISMEFMDPSSSSSSSSSTPSPTDEKMGVIDGGRERLIHMIDSLPKQLRDVADWRLASGRSQQDVIGFQQVMQAGAAEMLSYCSTRVPLHYLPYCRAMLSGFVHISLGLHYGDDPIVICLRFQFCPATSYVANSAHAVPVIGP